MAPNILSYTLAEKPFHKHMVKVGRLEYSGSRPICHRKDKQQKEIAALSQGFNPKVTVRRVNLCSVRV